MAASEPRPVGDTPPNIDYHAMKTAILNTNIQSLVGSMGTIEVAPARDVFESTIAILTLVVDQDEMKELAELCSRACHVLEALIGERGADNLSGLRKNIEDLRSTVHGIESAVREANNPLDPLEYNRRFAQESVNAWRVELCGALSALDTCRCQLIGATHAFHQPLQTELERGCAFGVEHVVDAGSLAPTLGTTIQPDEPNPPAPGRSSFPDGHIPPLAIPPPPIDSDMPSPPPLGNINHGTEPTAVSDSERMLLRLVSGFVPKNELPSAIETIVSNARAATLVGSLQRDDAQTFVDVVDDVLSAIDFVPPVRGKCVRSVYKMCAGHTLLPKSLHFELPENITGNVRYQGGFADVVKYEGDGREVAIKVLRVTECKLSEIMGSFCKEVIAWRNLRHPNVLPLLGAVMTENQFAMVSEWMTNGNITQFVSAHQDVNRFELLADVAKGLIYMHSQGMVHGDLKGANVLIDETCHARIADFGMLTIVPDPKTVAPSNSYQEGGTHRWTSPELLYPEKFGLKESCPTRSSDCYAFGMVVYEVLKGQVPFYGCNGVRVIGMVIEGVRPERPQGAEGVWFRDDIWNILERCWVPNPGDRPGVEAALHCLEVSILGTADPAIDPPSQDLDPGRKENKDGDQVSSSCQAEPQPLRMPLSEATFSDVMGRKNIGADTEHPDGSILKGSAADQDGTSSTNGPSRAFSLRRRIAGHYQQGLSQPNIPSSRASLVGEAAAVKQGPQRYDGVYYFGTFPRKAGCYVVVFFFPTSSTAHRRFQFK